MNRSKCVFIILWLLVAVAKAWAGNALVKFQSMNRISSDGDGLFTAASNAGNEYALALADLTTLPGIDAAQTITIQFYSHIPSGSRWLIGLGDKTVRGTNANGSNRATYNTDGLVLRFGTSDGTNFRVNGDTRNNSAFDQYVLATITLDRQAKTYSYTLTQTDNTVLFSATGVSTDVDNLTVIEAYSWLNDATVSLGDVLVSSDDLTGRFATPYPIISQTGSYQQSAYYMDSPTYSIYRSAGALSSSVAINATTGELTGLTAGGAVWVKASDGVTTAGYILTVAYRATAETPIEWNFFEQAFTTSDGLKEVPVPMNTTTGLLGETWRAEYKSTDSERAPEWYHLDAVNGENAFFVPETAGLIFHTAARNFYLRNDAAAGFKHIGIRGQNGGASFTIPLLEAGDIVELNWKHDADGSGSTYTATNLKDLRGKAVDEQFEITRSTDAHRGLYSFEVVADGDVTFTLHDNGNTDLLKVRVYKGGYVSTMRRIRLEEGNAEAPHTLIVDDAEQHLVYERCNNLNSTATGPGFYVLKGWREGEDDEAFITGSSASSTLQLYTDKDAYPVSDEEKARLYELRRHLKGFSMYNESRRPSNTNYYNYGHISVSGGWGKVTIRMNNYTNDMKYLIGYTPDYTLNIGPAPHQTYPYTWDFTRISTGMVAEWEANVAHAVSADAVNWTDQGEGTFLLNTDNTSSTGSQYVPGAVLVTTGKVLGKYGDGTNYELQAYDELDGLGVAGQVTISTPPVVHAAPRRATADGRLIAYQLSNPEFAYRQNLTAGNGIIYFGANADKRVTSDIAACGYAYQCDGDGGGNGTKYALLKPSRPLVAGDIIRLKAYETEGTADGTYGLSLYESRSTDTPLASLYLTQRDTEQTLTYTVAAGDALEGKESLYVFRNPAQGDNTFTTYLTEVEIVSSPATMKVNGPLYCNEAVTLTLPDLNADGRQHRIYVSSSAEPTAVTNAVAVSDGDANTSVWAYKVTAAGAVAISFPAGCYVYKIGVTDMLKEIHSVGSVGWATESRSRAVDHELTGYFTRNDVNAYAVDFDSYDLNTATVALTPVMEDGYVPAAHGLVLKLDDTSHLSLAEEGSKVPLFSPSYTRPQTTTATLFGTKNLMYRNLDRTLHWLEIDAEGYQKFILTNVHWTFDTSSTLAADEAAAPRQAEAAGFYRLHIWPGNSGSTGPDSNWMPANTAYLRVPADRLPVAVWNQYARSAPARVGTIAIRDASPQSGPDALTQVLPAVSDEERSDVWYTLSGVRLAGRPTAPGLYIKDGKKVSVGAY